MSRAENIVKYYFYQDIDAAFFNVISSVKQNIENRKKIFAKVLQIKKGDDKHVVVYVRSSNDKLGELDEDDYRLVYVVNLSEQGITVNKAADITYGNVYDGNINVDPLNIYYAGKRKFQNFKNMDKYIDFLEEEGVGYEMQYEVEVGKLKPTQENISVPRIKKSNKRKFNI